MDYVMCIHTSLGMTYYSEMFCHINMYIHFYVKTMYLLNKFKILFLYFFMFMQLRKIPHTLRPEVSNPSGSVVSKAKISKIQTFFTRQFQTHSQQKCSILIPLLSSTFPQGFQISNNFGHPTLGSWGKIGLKIQYMKKGQNIDGHCDYQTNSAQRAELVNIFNDSRRFTMPTI